MLIISKYLVVNEYLDFVVDAYLTFLETAQLFPRVAAPFHSPLSVSSTCSTSSPAFGMVVNFSYSKE